MKGLQINAKVPSEHKIDEVANNRLRAFLFSILEIDSAGEILHTVIVEDLF